MVMPGLERRARNVQSPRQEVTLTHGQETTWLGSPSVRAGGPHSSHPGHLTVSPRAKPGSAVGERSVLFPESEKSQQERNKGFCVGEVTLEGKPP